MTDAVAAEPPSSEVAGHHVIVVDARVMSYLVTCERLVDGLPDIVALAASGLFEGESAAGDRSLVTDAGAPLPMQSLWMRLTFTMSAAVLPAAAGVLAETYLLRALHEWMQGPTSGQFEVATSVAGVIPADRDQQLTTGLVSSTGFGSSTRASDGRSYMPKLTVRIPQRR